MQTWSPEHVRPHHMKSGAVRFPWALLAAVLLPVALLGCGPAEESTASEPLDTQSQALAVTNGLSLNGLSLNGLSLNGLSLNGLSLNGLSSSDFASWFSQDKPLAHEVMTYVVGCAVPADHSRSYTDPETGTVYTWTGNLGLAPEWSDGKPATVEEQQLVSACLAAHVNKYGNSVSISVLGETAKKKTIFSTSELETYSEREACFFGNLFTGEGVFAANDRDSLHDKESTARGCGRLAKDATPDVCQPVVRTTDCKSICQLDATKTYYRSCDYNGRKYVPLTTRLLPQDIYQCGDGICQMTESCGTGSEYYNCGSDCGACQ